MKKERYTLIYAGYDDTTVAFWYWSRGWKKRYGSTPLVYSAAWSGRAQYEPLADKLDRLDDRVQPLLDRGAEVNMIGISASGPLGAIKLAEKNPKISGLVTVVAPLNTNHNRLPKRVHRSPALVDAITRCEQIDPAKLEEMLIMRSFYDWLLPDSMTVLPGVKTKTSRVPLHWAAQNYKIMNADKIFEFLNRNV